MLLGTLNFYRQPNYSIYSVAPGRHKEVQIEAIGRKGSRRRHCTFDHRYLEKRMAHRWLMSGMGS